MQTTRRQWIQASLAAAMAMPGAGAAEGRKVALTIDDGPVDDPSRDLATFQKIADGLRESFVAEKVPVTLFINERKLNTPGQRDGRISVLEKWLDAGLDIGNHTYSHRSANRTPVWQFQDDIVKGEVIMRPLIEARGKKLVWFRWPFLDSGATAETHQALVDFLTAHQYKVAHVTVDYKDYEFADAYTRELRSGTPETVEKVKQMYLDFVEPGFENAEQASMAVYGREIPQILLIHCSNMNSVTLRDSIARMRRRGYSFVSLEEATSDPAYARPDTFAGSGGSWLERSAVALNKPRTPGMQGKVPAWIYPPEQARPNTAKKKK